MRTSEDYLMIEGTRGELLAEIRRLHVGWIHLGNPRLAAGAESALRELTEGVTSVRVGHVVYDVTDLT